MSGICGMLSSISSFMSGQIPSAQNYYTALNNKSIPVHDRHSDLFLARTIKMLARCK